MKPLFKIDEIITNNSNMWHSGGSTIIYQNRGSIGQEGKILEIYGEYTTHYTTGTKVEFVYLVEWTDGSGKCSKSESQLKKHHTFYIKLRNEKIKNILNETN